MTNPSPLITTMLAHVVCGLQGVYTGYHLATVISLLGLTRMFLAPLGRNIKRVESMGFEPTIACMPYKCITSYATTPK
jgi:hypothetical protein